MIALLLMLVVNLQLLRDAAGKLPWAGNPGGQIEFLQDQTSDVKCAKAGNRSGKTHAAVRDHLVKRMVNRTPASSTQPRALYLPGLIVAPTFRDWKTTIWPSLKKAADEARLGAHWNALDGVVLFTRLRSGYGPYGYAYSIVKSAEAAKEIKNFEVADIWREEVGHVREKPDDTENDPIGLATTRRSLEAPYSQDVWTGTPLGGPGNPLEVWWETCERHPERKLPDTWRLHHWSTLENEQNLREGYVASMLRGIPAFAVQAVIYGNTARSTTSRAYPDYGDANRDTSLRYTPSLPVMLTVDWNVEPGVAGLSQFSGRRQDTHIFIVGEIVQENNASVRETGKQCLAWLKSHGHKGDLYVRGDPSDPRTQASHETAATQLKRILREELGDRLHWKIRRDASPQHDRLARCNAMILSGSGEVHLHCNPDLAPWHDRDFMRVEVGPDGKLRKDDRGPGKLLTHASDGIAEAAYDLWPDSIEPLEGRGSRPMQPVAGQRPPRPTVPRGGRRGA